MAYTDVISVAKTYFPDLQIKFKDQDPLMKLIGVLMFFNPGFMKSFITTLGDTVYFPNEQWAIDNPRAFNDVFIHECVHMHDEKKNGVWYKLGYAFPQVLAPLSLLLLLVLSWKLVLPLMLILLAPLPAPFRTMFERRAYFVQMYVAYQLYGMDPVANGEYYAQMFQNGSYYFMSWAGQSKQFAQEASNIKMGDPECLKEPDLFKMVNDLITGAKA